MNIIVVAKNSVVMSEIAAAVKKAYADDSVEAFVDPLMSMKYGALNRIDVAILTIDLKRMLGVQFGGILRKKYPDVKLVFVADNRREMSKIANLPDSHRICRPVTAETVRRIIHTA